MLTSRLAALANLAWNRWMRERGEEVEVEELALLLLLSVTLLESFSSLPVRLWLLQGPNLARRSYRSCSRRKGGRAQM